MRTALVTGAHGLVGSWLVPALLDRGVRVVLLEREGSAGGPLRANGDAERCTAVRATLGDGDGDGLRRALDEHAVDTVFHLAARSTAGDALRDPVATFETNVRGTWLLVDACRRHGAERVVVASTERVYGAAEGVLTEDTPLLARLPYDVSKAGADLIARSAWAAHRLPVATVRTSNVYGGGDANRSRLVPELVGAVLAGRAPVIHSDGSARRRWLHAQDAAAAYLAVAGALGPDGPAGGEAFNAGGEDLVSVRELADRLLALAGSDLEPDVRGTAAPAGTPPDRLDLDSGRLRAVTGWAPRVGLDEGLRRTLDWYRAHPEQLAP